jgi:ABC-2 type transport system permease protein
MKIIRDTWLIFVRSLMLTLRNPIWVFIGLMQPILYLALFAPLLQPIVATPGFPPGGAFDVFVPGLLVQLGLFGAFFVGFGLIAELRAGVVERMRVTPVSRVAMMLGRALRDATFLLVQAAILIVIAIPFGLNISPLGFVLALILLGFVSLIMSPLSYTVALWLKSEDALAPFLNAVALPVLLLSGILLPMSLAPRWLQLVAAVNPLSHAVEAMRALFLGNFGDPIVAIGVGLMFVLAIVSLIVAGRAFGSSQA